MKNAEMIIRLTAVVLLVAVGQGLGVTQYKDGGTHDISSTIDDMVWVDYQTPGMQTTVNVLEGGIITGYFYGYKDSRINVAGGTVNSYMRAFDNCCATLSSGTVYNFLGAEDNGSVAVSGGMVNGYLRSSGNSQITLSGGTVNSFLQTYDNGQIAMSGGTVSGYLQSYNNGQIIITGGTVNALVIASNSGEMVLILQSTAILLVMALLPVCWVVLLALSPLDILPARWPMVMSLITNS